MTPERRFWVAFAFLAAVGLFLGGRTRQAVRSVLHSGTAIASASMEGEAADRELLQDLARKEEALAPAADPPRDPFRARPAAVAASAPSGGPRTIGVARVPPPELRGLLHDGRRPIVQLRSGREQSRWLGVGDVFLGWTIEEIREDSVRLSRPGTSVVLTSS